MTRVKIPAIIFCILALSGAVIGKHGALSRSVELQSGPQNTSGPLTTEQAKALKSPVKFTKESIAKGRVIFSRNCTTCHGNDAKAQVDVVADATDLTDPKVWKNGTSEGEIFRSIRDGAGAEMPSFKAQFHEEDIWNLVNFIRSLWPAPLRPKLQGGSSTDPDK